MKKIIALSAILLCISQFPLQAGDDVYDAPAEKKVRVKQERPAPEERTVPQERTVPYEEENSPSRTQSPTYNNQNDNYNNSYDNNYSSDDWNYSYSDRLRRFHNPSVRFSYGWSVCNNSFYDPWNAYGYQPSYITPSWAYTYNDFYNPFWSSSVVVYDPWGYPSPYYSPYNSWYSPTCSAIIYGNGYNSYPYYGNGGYGGYYGGGYEVSPRNTYNGPRTGGYSNTNSHPRGSNYTGSSNTNNSGIQNNNPQSAPAKRWNNAGNNSNTYKYSNPNINRESPAPQQRTEPSNNGWNNNNSNNNGSGGIRIGTRPK